MNWKHTLKSSKGWPNSKTYLGQGGLEDIHMTYNKHGAYNKLVRRFPEVSAFSQWISEFHYITLNRDVDTGETVYNEDSAEGPLTTIETVQCDQCKVFFVPPEIKPLNLCPESTYFSGKKTKQLCKKCKENQPCKSLITT